jgi:hypothetical protein
MDNKAAPGISYYTPLQDPPAGSAAIPQSDGSDPPRLFQPFTVRGKTFHNRIGVSYPHPYTLSTSSSAIANCNSTSSPPYVNTAPMMAI